MNFRLSRVISNALFVFAILLSVSQKVFSNAEDDCIRDHLERIRNAPDQQEKLNIYNEGLACYAAQGLNLRGWHADLAGKYCAETNAGNYSAMYSCNSGIQNYDDNNPVVGKCFECFPQVPSSVPNIRSCIQSNSSLNAGTMSKFKAPPGSSCSSEQKPPEQQKEDPVPQDPTAQAGKPEAACLQQVKEKLSKCSDQDYRKAGEECSPEVVKKNKDYNDSMNLMTTISKIGGQMVGMQDPCNKMSQAMNGVGTALQLYKKTCNEKRVVCSDSCQEVLDDLDNNKNCSPKVLVGGQMVDSSGDPEIQRIRAEANQNLGACSDGGQYSQNESQAGNQAMELMNSAATMANCAKLTKGFNPKMGNAFSPECSGPGAATNPMCAGVGYMGGGSGAGGMPGGVRFGGSSGGLLPNGNAAVGGGDFGSGGPGIDPTDPRAGAGSGGGNSGKGNGAMGGGLNADSSDGSGGGGAASAGYDMYGGFRSGGALGAGGRKGGAGGSADPAALAAGLAGGGNPDLRRFLPGGPNDPARRGLAGVTGPDGITGPHSDLWQKVKNRYQATTDSLLP